VWGCAAFHRPPRPREGGLPTTVGPAQRAARRRRTSSALPAALAVRVRADVLAVHGAPAAILRNASSRGWAAGSSPIWVAASCGEEGVLAVERRNLPAGFVGPYHFADDVVVLDEPGTRHASGRPDADRTLLWRTFGAHAGDRCPHTRDNRTSVLNAQISPTARKQ
jgi:hypothetical protein